MAVLIGMYFIASTVEYESMDVHICFSALTCTLPKMLSTISIVNSSLFDIKLIDVWYMTVQYLKVSV